MDKEILDELRQIKKLLVVLCTKNLEQKSQIQILSAA